MELDRKLSKKAKWKMVNEGEAQIVMTLIRHGQTPANEEHRYIGWTDQSLSEEGKSEAKKLQGFIHRNDIVFASPMKRCIETAELVFENDKDFDRDKIQIIDDYKELNFGKFEMRTHIDMREDKDYINWLDSRGEGQIPGGESKQKFIDRVMRGFENCLDICDAARGKDGYNGKIFATCVVHGGTIMAIRSQITGEEYFDCMIPNGSKYQLFLSKDE